MGVKIDNDLRDMAPGQLRQEVMKLRSAIRTEVNNTGNRRCWVNFKRVLPEHKGLDPLALPECEFIGNCKQYFRRYEKRPKARR
jgi:hypothetical protein